MKHNTLIFLLGFFMLQFACSPDFEPVDYGHDACAHCRMTIMDKRYAAELITPKGKAYKFDDAICMLQYMSANQVSPDSRLLIADHSDATHPFIDARKAIYLHNPSFKTPMNGNYAAFASEKAAVPLKDNLEQKLLHWEDLTRINP
ncbi:nitrous oxide reductase accessory protein NosL [Chitinophaga flava]|nr:nitrous oxide reductase accessory protein NosL [Chitinophaga flava]